MFWVRLLRAVTTRYPLNTPRASILNALPAIPLKYSEFQGKRGIRYRGYWTNGDEICRSLFWFGDFDPWVDRTLVRLARPRSVALDVGANIGATALTLANAVGPQGRVVCFEPIPPNIAHLRENIDANGVTWVDVVPAALSDKPGQLSMILPRASAGRSSVTTDDDREANFRVSSTTFDDWITTQPPLDISVCKIDVEGHETRVFAGMEQTLSKRIIPAFVFERHISEGSQNDPVFTLLKSKGYRVLRIEKGFMRVLYLDITARRRARQTHDYVAVLPDILPGMRARFS